MLKDNWLKHLVDWYVTVLLYGTNTNNHLHKQAIQTKFEIEKSGELAGQETVVFLLICAFRKTELSTNVSL